MILAPAAAPRRLKPTARIVWEPHPGSQVRFLSCPIFECLLEGSRGGGKTDALLMCFAQFVGAGFGQAWRGVLFRETYPQLADVVAKSKRWFRQFWPEAKFNESDYSWSFPDGEKLLFRYGAKEDDYWNYHGHEYPAILFEELTNWKSLAFYEMMQSCCRSSFPGMPRMVRATCNPYGRGHHAVKERFQISDDPRENEGRIIQDAQGRQRTYVHSDIHENSTLLAADPLYLASLEGQKDPNRRKAWLLGRWDINIGAFLEGAWKPERHIVQPFPIPPHWKTWMAMDWGFGKPYACLWFAKDPEGKTYVWRELYGVAKDEDGKVRPNVGVKESPKTVAARIKTREEHDARVGREISLRLTGPDLFAKGDAGAPDVRGGRAAGVRQLRALHPHGAHAAARRGRPRRRLQRGRGRGPHFRRSQGGMYAAHFDPGRGGRGQGLRPQRRRRHRAGGRHPHRAQRGAAAGLTFRHRTDEPGLGSPEPFPPGTPRWTSPPPASRPP
jgi:hypothetical protein